MDELKTILEKFIDSEWNLTSVPSQQWLTIDKSILIAAIKEADKECGGCKFDFDALYKRALELL